jgi:hypothetical protein
MMMEEFEYCSLLGQLDEEQIMMLCIENNRTLIH